MGDIIQNPEHLLGNSRNRVNEEDFSLHVPTQDNSFEIGSDEETCPIEGVVTLEESPCAEDNPFIQLSEENDLKSYLE